MTVLYVRDIFFLLEDIQMDSVTERIVIMSILFNFVNIPYT